MTVQRAATLSIRHPEARAEFDRARAGLEMSCGQSPIHERCARARDLAEELDAAVVRVRDWLLAPVSSCDEGRAALIAWICDQHRGLEEISLRLARPLRTQPRDPALVRMTALALMHWADAVKWDASRVREYRSLHELYRSSAAAGLANVRLRVRADGIERGITLEDLYLRGLLLDRFASRTFSRAQTDILSGWLWEWSGGLRTEDSRPPGAAMRVDLDANAGLRDAEPPGEGASLYLALDALEARRRAITCALHAGQVMPSGGPLSQLPLDDHVAVLDHLQRELRQARGRSSQRATRAHEVGKRVEVWVGMSGILARGLRIGIETGRWRVRPLPGPDSADSRPAACEDSRRHLRLADPGIVGFGFEGPQKDAAGIGVGELLGWRDFPAGALALGHVVRRVDDRTPGTAFLGVEVLTLNAQPIPFTQVDGDGTAVEAAHLLVADGGDSARRDAFIVSEATFDRHDSYHVVLRGERHVLRFDEARAKGPGWVLAGFQLLPEKANQRPGEQGMAPSDASVERSPR